MSTINHCLYEIIAKILYLFCLLFLQLWGVDIVSGNAVNWLECVAKGRQVTLKPIATDKDTLVSTVLLHLPQPKVFDVITGTNNACRLVDSLINMLLFLDKICGDT